jgi:hypothetical protein
MALVFYLALFAWAFFRLPFAFPVPPSVSASYVFQYNNHVAVLIFIAGTAGFAMLFNGLSLEQASRDSRVSRLSAAIAILAITALGIFFYVISIPEGLHGEAPYFYSRLAELAAGKTIYRDFEFAYGPLLLYLPFWTGKLFHAGLVNGYFLFWLADCAVGIWILFRLVNAIEIASPYRTAIFFLLVVEFAGALWSTGINYAPLRPLLSAAMAMLVFAAWRRGYPPARVAMLAVAGAGLDAAFSPEHGIAFMLGTGLFFLTCVRERSGGYWLAMTIMACGFVAIVVASARAGAYITLRAFSSGGSNYPVMPTEDVLLVMALFVIAACVAFRAFQQKRTDVLFLYLLCISLFGMPASFGRADSGHMQLGAFPAVVIAALALGRYPKIALVIACAFFYLDATSQFRGEVWQMREATERWVFNPAHRAGLAYRGTVLGLQVLHADAHRAAMEAKVDAYYDHQMAIPALSDDFIVMAPWGSTSDGMTDSSGKIDYGYYYGIQDVIVPSEVESMIESLQAQPERKLLLPTVWRTHCYTSDDGDPSFQTWHGFHWASPKRKMQLYFPFCDFVVSHYAPGETRYRGFAQLWDPVTRPTARAADETPSADQAGR